jgi:hypothetical protein
LAPELAVKPAPLTNVSVRLEAAPAALICAPLAVTVPEKVTVLGWTLKVTVSVLLSVKAKEQVYTPAAPVQPEGKVLLNAVAPNT